MWVSFAGRVLVPYADLVTDGFPWRHDYREERSPRYADDIEVGEEGAEDQVVVVSAGVEDELGEDVEGTARGRA